MYNCPFCSSGTGENGTGALSIIPGTNRFRCFSCGKSGDVIDLYLQVTGCDYVRAVSELAERIGISNDASSFTWQETDARTEVELSPPVRHRRNYTISEPKDYSEYFRECQERINDRNAVDYLTGRGISIETANRAGIGYDPKSVMSNHGRVERRIIVPCGAGGYLGRALRDGDGSKLNCGKLSFFMGHLLYGDAKVLFVTEGAFDALSIMEAGGDAIALNSTANAGKLLEILERKGTDALLVLCMDNDKSGREATKKLSEGLYRIKARFNAENVSGDAKDPNEALCQDRAAFIERVQKIIEKYGNIGGTIGVTVENNNTERDAGEIISTAEYLDTFFEAEKTAFRRGIKTGFDELDKQTGGLIPGVYILAAVPSMGKTTFALQMADQIAAAGEDVLFFSLEQSRIELVSKSLARCAAQINPGNAPTALQIRSGGADDKTVRSAIQRYRDAVGDRVRIIEGQYDLNAQQVQNQVQKRIDAGKKPVVFIDYLQILRPQTERATAKESVEDALRTLQIMSKKHSVPVVVISSMNRNSYSQPFDLDSLKESGGIEYSADAVLGLGYPKDAQADDEKGKTVRTVHLKCVKNRHGTAVFDIPLRYDAAHDQFMEEENQARTHIQPRAGRPARG